MEVLYYYSQVPCGQYYFQSSNITQHSRHRALVDVKYDGVESQSSSILLLRLVFAVFFGTTDSEGEYC